MSAMNRMNKKDLRNIYEDIGSTIDLDTWTYSEEFQGMIKLVNPSNLEDVFVLSFDSEFHGDYSSNVLTLKREIREVRLQQVPFWQILPTMRVLRLVRIPSKEPKRCLPPT